MPIAEVEELVSSILDGSHDIEESKKLSTEVEVTKYDSKTPLYVNGNGGDGSDFVFRSILAKSKGDFASGGYHSYVDSYKWKETKRWISFWKEKMSFDDETIKKIQQQDQGKYEWVNLPLNLLYHIAYSDTLNHWPEVRNRKTLEYFDVSIFPYKKTAYGDYWYRPLLEVSDEEPLNKDWDKSKDLWHYSLIVPKKKVRADLIQKTMQRDLSMYFDYEVTVETREMPCWFLRAKPGAAQSLATKTPGAKLGTKEILDAGEKLVHGTNRDVRDFIYQLAMLVSRSRIFRDTGPIINETGIKGEIDFIIPAKAFEAYRKNDFEGYRDMLKNHTGLYLEKGTKPMKVVVIRDSKQEF